MQYEGTGNRSVLVLLARRWIQVLLSRMSVSRAIRVQALGDRIYAKCQSEGKEKVRGNTYVGGRDGWAHELQESDRSSKQS